MVAGIWKPDLGGLAGNLMPGLPTTMGDVYDAAYADGLTGHSVLARQFALEQAIDEKNDRIKAATGVVLPNPTRAAVDYEKPQEGVDEDAARNWADYRRQLGELRDRFPERFDILADFDENEIAKAQTRANDKRLGEVSAMGPGGGATFMASLAGGFVASLRDPPQLIANILAPGAGFGKSLLYHGVKSAAINMTVEAGIQPFVQSWRAEAGVESGLNEAMKDILMAGVAGGAIDVVGRGAFRAAKVYRGGKWVDDPVAPDGAAGPQAGAAAPGADPAAPVARAAPADIDAALDDAAKRLPDDHPIRQAAEGRPEALVREVEKLGEQATPELRALAHRAETEVLFGPQGAMDEVAHIEGMAQAIRNAVAPEIEPPGFSGARSPQLSRMVDGGLVPEDLAALVARSAPLERQADLAQLLLDKSPATPDAARRILADELSKPVAQQPARRYADPQTGSELSRSEVDGLVDMWRFVESVRRADRPEALTEFLIRSGGVSDAATDVRSMIGGARSRPGLVNGNGMALDDAARLAWDAGYLTGSDRPDINKLLEALDDDVRGNRIYRQADVDRVDDIRIAAEMERELADFGLGRARNADAVYAFFERSGAGGAEDLAPSASIEGYRQARLGARGFEEPRGEGAKLQTEALVRDVQSRIDAVRDLNAAAAKLQANPAKAAPEAADTQAKLSDYIFDTGIDEVARREGAFPITKLRPWSSHTGPVLAFHGTTADFAKFDLSKAVDFGLHFGTPEQASAFAGGTTFRGDAKGKPGRVFPVVLDMKNPVTMADLGDWTPAKMVAGLKDAGVVVSREIEQLSAVPKVSEREFNARLRAELEAKGFDGIRYLNQVEGKGLTWSYIVWKPGTVRSASSGDMLFRQSAPRAYAPEFLAREADVEAELVKVAQRLPKAVRVQLERNIQIGRYELDGYWDRRNNVLAVALDKGVDAANGTMRHEEIHALRHFGLFTDREWGLLTERAGKLGIRRDIGLDGLAEYREMYVPMVAKDMIRARGWNEAADLPWAEIKRTLKLAEGDEIAGLQRLGLWDEGRLQSLLDEEAVAELASRRRAGESFGARLDKIIDRIAEFLEATYNALRGLGFDTADAVFRRIETGEVGGRADAPDVRARLDIDRADLDAEGARMVEVCNLG
jgi:hypothetical protein